MAGYGGHDALINEMTVNGQFFRGDYSKLTSPAYTAGGWHLLVGNNGFPNAGTFPGTDLLWSNCSGEAGDGTTVIGMPTNGNVEPATKHLLTVGAHIVAAAGAPWQAKLVDLQGYYRLSTTNVTGTGSRVLINSNTFTASSSSGLLLTYANDWKTFTKVRLTTTGTLPGGTALATDYWLVRQSATTAKLAASYADAVNGVTLAFVDAGTGTHTLTIKMPRYDNGVGCDAFFVVQTAPTLGGPNLTASSYTNSAGVAGRAFQGSPSMGAAADAYATRVLHSGNAAGRYGAFLPRQGGDTGVESIQSFTWSTGTAYTGTGVVALCIARPLGVDIAIPVSGMLSKEDLVNQIPSLPRVVDGACLAWMLFSTGATTANSPMTSIIQAGWA